MRRIVVLSTGGTIATRQDAHGTRLAADPADALLERLPRPPGVPVETRDVFCLGSYLLTPADMREVAVAAHEALADESVRGVVVTHGTDSLEETAYLLDLFHADPRPVVFTGAMRPADAPDGDGPRNLADALAVANAARARDLGVLISFDGRIYPARGTRKTHTVAPAAFAAPDGGPLGRVADGDVEITAAPLRPKPLDLAAFRPEAPERIRTDIVAVYPGCDIRALRAVADAGARAVVLEATGAGNANPQVAAEVARLVASGVVVALSTRVHAGPVAAVYGNGGGADLVRAGAIPTGTLRPSQARVLLTALLGCYGDPARVRTALRTALESAPESAPETPSERNQHG
ncbi:L-asparaginase [Streptomyces himastatinicus ATCC 53653]|uniref:asparaginase n=1 Tax=Streptomyces himastatinicus ATCC 53653 TaxID=457427 RepID=D9WAE6_9ACTN|nr:asparaginase [Streptomyces himastatinicus]EFL26887.1 L-asparaginase [Streptomyces himastatinicus ATCC 53653]